MRRRAEVTVRLHAEVTELVLRVEQNDRLIALLTSQQLSRASRMAVMEAAYRTGAGGTSHMIVLRQQSENLAATLTEATVEREQSIRKLLVLTGHETADNLAATAGNRFGNGMDEAVGVVESGEADSSRHRSP